MKKVLLITALIMFMFIRTATAQVTWREDCQCEIEWDACTSAQPDEIVGYEVYQCDALRDPNKTAIKLLCAETSTNEFTYTPDAAGQYLIGVMTTIKLNGIVIGRSDISWSDNSAVVLDGKMFGLRCVKSAPKPTGLRCLGF